MKSILFIGATLMVGACIYGFVDYKSTNQKKEFKSLYRNEAVETKSPVSPKPVTETKTIEKVNEKAIPAVVPDKATIVQAEEKKTAGTKRKVTRNKRIHLKEYSRAKLEEEIILAPEKQQ